MKIAKKYVIPLLFIATVLAGMLSPMQSAVNGQVGKELGDGNASAVVSFGSGLVVMAVIILSRKSTRQQFVSIPSRMRAGRIPWWSWLAGLCGAMVVFSEGASASVLGVATFQTTLISGMVISGLLCDRFGIGVEIKQPFNVPRVLGAILAVAATVLVVLPNWQAPSVIGLAVLPFLAGLLAGWQPAGNSAVARETGSMLVSITWNFIVGFTVLALALLIRVLIGPSSTYLVDVSRWPAWFAVHRPDGPAGAWTWPIASRTGLNSRSANWFCAYRLAGSGSWRASLSGNGAWRIRRIGGCGHCCDPIG